jgi:cation diffusion facilitator CzcD-associated flavoprotein CzcO
VSHLTSFVRSHVWVSPAPGINEPTENDPEVDDKYNYAPHVIEKFKSEPRFCQEHRQALINRRIVNFRRNIRDSDVQRDARELFRQTMIERLGKSEKGKKLAEMLIPPFPVGCRRQTPGPGYLEALIQDNVDTRWDDISAFTEKGILTKSGQELDFDIIICATGFDTTFKPRFPIVGRGGVDLAKRWMEDLPISYFGMTVPDFPNYFSMSHCLSYKSILRFALLYTRLTFRKVLSGQDRRSVTGHW